MTLARFRSEYGTTRDGDLGRRYGMTLREVRSLAKSQALGKDSALFPGARYRLWSKADLTLLRAQYGVRTNREIGTTLRRSARAVLNQAVKLGLRKTPEHLSKVLAENPRLS